MNKDSGFFLFCDCIYLFWDVLGLHFCAGFPLAAVTGSYCQVAGPGVLSAVASPVLVVRHRLWGLRAPVVVIPRL